MKSGNGHANARARRWHWVAVAVAAWCMAWPAAMMALSSGYPDVFPVLMRPGAGAYNFFQGLTHRYAWLTLALCGAVVFVLTRALGAAGRRLDPDCRVMQAVRWTLGSRSLNACMVAICIAIAIALAAAAAAKGPSRFDSFFEWAFDQVVATSILGMIFCAFVLCLVWNRVTLARPRLEHWWIPGWPGWRQVVFALPLLAAICAIEVLDKAAMGFMGLFAVAIGLVDSAAIGLLSCMIASLWMGGPDMRWRGSAAHVRRALPELAWAWLLGWLVEALIAVPVLSIAITQIFFIPQYDAMARSHGQGLSAGLEFVVKLAHFPALFLQLPLVGLALYQYLFQGRLLSMRSP